MNDSNQRKINEKLVHAYNVMMDRVDEAIRKADTEGMPVLERSIEAAKRKASELGELTQEEAQKVGDYLKRDLQDAADYVADTGEHLADWMKFDLELIEDRLRDVFSTMVDHTRMELGKLAERATLIGEWHTGEITSIGTLQCKGCGEKLHFHATGHIPPCPKCKGTSFRRLPRED